MADLQEERTQITSWNHKTLLASHLSYFKRLKEYYKMLCIIIVSYKINITFIKSSLCYWFQIKNAKLFQEEMSLLKNLQYKFFLTRITVKQICFKIYRPVTFSRKYPNLSFRNFYMQNQYRIKLTKSSL